MKALFFDFDGVIVDTNQYGIHCFSLAGISVSEEEFKKHHDGNVFEKPAIPVTDKSRELFRDHYFNNIHTLSPLFDSTLLEKLSKNYRIFIISSNRERSINKFLQHHNLETYFIEVTGGETHHSKVWKFGYLCGKYNVSIAESYFITDTLGDLIEANTVGIRSIATTFGCHEKERLQKGTPYKYIDQPVEALDILL